MGRTNGVFNFSKRSSLFGRNSNSTTGRTTANKYSSYNLYIVYLAIPDLCLNLYLLFMYCNYANQNFYPNFLGCLIQDDARNITDIGYSFEGALIISCSTANLFLNCLV